MHILEGSLGGGQLSTRLTDIMSTKQHDMQADFQHPQFFISQSEKLTTLLTVVVAESKVVTDPEACVDYLELTEILAELLDKAQLYSVLSSNELQRREQQVRVFLSKIQTVQDAVADWDERTGASVKGVSKKRPLPNDLQEETMRALRRRRDTANEMEMVANAAFDGPFAIPSIETSPTQWWTEPFYD